MISPKMAPVIALALMFAPIGGVSTNAQQQAEHKLTSALAESQVAVHPDIADQMEINQATNGCRYIIGWGWTCW